MLWQLKDYQPIWLGYARGVQVWHVIPRASLEGEESQDRKPFSPDNATPNHEISQGLTALRNDGVV